MLAAPKTRWAMVNLYGSVGGKYGARTHLSAAHLRRRILHAAQGLRTPAPPNAGARAAAAGGDGGHPPLSWGAAAAGAGGGGVAGQNWGGGGDGGGGCEYTGECGRNGEEGIATGGGAAFSIFEGARGGGGSCREKQGPQISRFIGEGEKWGTVGVAARVSGPGDVTSSVWGDRRGARV